MEKNSKTVIITGGNRGIGESISRFFLDRYYKVLIGSRNGTSLTSELSSNVRFKKTDVCNESEHLLLAETALNWTGRLDVYINCAGFSEWHPISDVDENFWNKMIDINLKGTFWGCKTAAKFLKNGGSIINISSIAGKRGSVNNSVYCASKFGVNGITQSLAKELGFNGIRVNAVCPVYIETEGLIASLKDPNSPAKGTNVSDYLQRFADDNSALKRLPTGEDVAKLCYFLASNEASAITGQCINVDCGVLPQ